jgi:ATP-binding protein involved in chromosome partitioning
MSLTVEIVRQALRGVDDPEIHKDLVSLNMVGDISIDGTAVRLRIDLTTPACPLKGKISGDIDAALLAVGATTVDIEWGAQVRQQLGGAHGLIPGVKNVIAVGAGKGGVGKSTVAVNIAAALAQSGASVGLLDGDIYGPSMPTMLGLTERPKAGADQKILPMHAHGMLCISMGSFVPAEAALIWRGPMLNNALRQFFADVRWGELDYLVIDLPPGTGDVPLSLSQMVNVGAAVIVTTPQDVALADVVRAKTMFDQLKIPVAGLIENMAGFTPPGSDQVIDLFGAGGGEKAAAKLGVPLLGSLPIEPEICVGGDAGTPLVISHPNHPVAQRFTAVAEALAGKLSMLSASEPKMPPPAPSEGGLQVETS